MVGIQGLGGIPEPKPERSGRVRGDREDASSAASSADGSAPAKDDVNISTEARAAAEAGRIVQLSKTEGEIRAERVAAAKERIDQGHYRDPDVVAKVAERLLKFLS